MKKTLKWRTNTSHQNRTLSTIKETPLTHLMRITAAHFNLTILARSIWHPLQMTGRIHSTIQIVRPLNLLPHNPLWGNRQPLLSSACWPKFSHVPQSATPTCFPPLREEDPSTTRVQPLRIRSSQANPRTSVTAEASARNSSVERHPTLKPFRHRRPRCHSCVMQ